jgi:putative oxidoreductase
MNTGLLVLRLAIGPLLAGHGIQKISHRLGGQRIAGGAADGCNRSPCDPTRQR